MEGVSVLITFPPPLAFNRERERETRVPGVGPFIQAPDAAVGPSGPQNIHQNTNFTVRLSEEQHADTDTATASVLYEA